VLCDVIDAIDALPRIASAAADDALTRYSPAAQAARLRAALLS